MSSTETWGSVLPDPPPCPVMPSNQFPTCLAVARFCRYVGTRPLACFHHCQEWRTIITSHSQDLVGDSSKNIHAVMQLTVGLRLFTWPLLEGSAAPCWLTSHSGFPYDFPSPSTSNERCNPTLGIFARYWARLACRKLPRQHAERCTGGHLQKTVRRSSSDGSQATFPQTIPWTLPGPRRKTWFHLQRPSGSFHVSLRECTLLQMTMKPPKIPAFRGTSF